MRDKRERGMETPWRIKRAWIARSYKQGKKDLTNIFRCFFLWFSSSTFFRDSFTLSSESPAKMSFSRLRTLICCSMPYSSLCFCRMCDSNSLSASWFVFLSTSIRWKNHKELLFQLFSVKISKLGYILCKDILTMFFSFSSMWERLTCEICSSKEECSLSFSVMRFKMLFCIKLQYQESHIKLTTLEIKHVPFQKPPIVPTFISTLACFWASVFFQRSLASQ